MRHWGNVFDLADANASTIEGTDRSLAAGTRTFYVYLNHAEAEFMSFTSSIAGGNLCSVRRRFFRTTEFLLTSGSPTDNITFLICDSDDDVVEDE